MSKQIICNPNTLTIFNDNGDESKIYIDKPIELTISEETIHAGEWCVEEHDEYPCDKIRFPNPNNPKKSYFLRQSNMNYVVDKDSYVTNNTFPFRKDANGTMYKVIAANIELPGLNNLKKT